MNIVMPFKTFEAAALAHDELLTSGVSYAAVELSNADVLGTSSGTLSATVVTVTDACPVGPARVSAILEKYAKAER